MEIGTEMIKLNWKFRIAYAILTALTFVMVLCLLDYGIDGDFQSLNSYLFQGLSFGIFVGIGFPYVTQKFGKRFISKFGKNVTPELTQDERIEVKGPSNLFRRMESVGGKLFLTNKKMVFVSHKLNIQKGQTDIYYEDIIEITERKIAKLIDNGIRIKTIDGKEFDFVVNEREKWIEKLYKKITA